jgi:hypothetical protein
MRTTPLIGAKPWFGPRRVGWGLGPVSPEGWAATLAFSALALVTRRRKLPSPWIRHAVVGGFLILAFLKGSAPGGPRARAAFDAAEGARREGAVTTSGLGPADGGEEISG